MQIEKGHKTQSRRKKWARIIQLFLAIVIILLVSGFLLLPVFISSGKCRELILARINKSVAGRADFSDLSMGWFKGIRISDLSFNDNTGQASVQVKQITTKPHYGSILMGDLSFGQTMIDKPQVSVNLKAKSAAAYERVGKPVPVPVKTGRNIALVMDLMVNDGDLKVTDSRDRTVEVSQINSTLNLRPLGQQTSFKADMAVANTNSKISAAGNVTPDTKTGWTLKGTTGDFTVEVNELNLESLGPIFELAGVNLQAEGILSANMKSEVKDGRIENLSANVKANNLNIGGQQLKGDRLHSSILVVDTRLSQKEQAINIDQLHVQSDWVQADAGGTVPMSFKSLSDILQPGSNFSLKGNFTCDVAEILSQMPKTIGIKEGMNVTSGKLSGSISTLTQAGKVAITGQAGLTGLAGMIGDKKLAISEPVTAALEITGEKDRISFDKLNVSASFAKINAAGNLEQINYDSQINLNKLQSELGQFVDIGPYQMAGEVSNKGQVSINDDKIIAAGSSMIKDLRLSSKNGVTAFEPSVDVAFDLNFDKKSNVVNVASIKADTGLGQVTVKDAVLPLSSQSPIPMKLSASAGKIDLQKVQPFLVLFASFPDKIQLAGVAESQIQISSQGGIYQIASNNTKITNFRLASADKKPFEQPEVLLAFETEINETNPVQKTINVKKLQLESPQIKINKGQFVKSDSNDQTTMRAQVECDYDWSAVSLAASAFLPVGFEVAGRQQSVINFSTQYPSGQTDKLLANLTGGTNIGFEKAQYMGLNFGPTKANLQMEKGLLKISPFSAPVNNGQLSFAGQANFNQKPTILQMPGPIQLAKDIQINKETTEKLLMYVNPIFANAVNVSGLANFYCEKLAIPLTGGSSKNIEVIGTISMSNLRLEASDLLGQILSVTGSSVRGQQLTVHPTKFVLQDGFLRYNDMQVDVGDNPINFKGTIGLDKSLDMTVTLPYTVEGRTARVGRDSVGERISLPLKGTINKPQLDVANLLGEQLKQQLLKGLEGILK